MGEREALSHIKDLLTWRSFIKGENSSLGDQFSLASLFRWRIKLPGFWKDPTLACLLKHWKDLGPESLQQKQLQFYYTQTWVSSGR
jgi:hypothetical protein